MEQKTYNLDDNFSEYFEFTLFGEKYKFRYPTPEEIEKMAGIDKEDPNADKKAREYIYTFISPVSHTNKFAKAAKKMNLPQWRAFLNMIKTEFAM